MQRIKRIWGMILLLLCLAGGLTGCQILSGSYSLEKVYKPAYENCLEEIGELFPDKKVNTSMVSVRYLNEEEREQVFIIVNGEKEYFEEHEELHWVFTIGNTSGFDFVQLVCSSTTNEVIGYLTIE